MTSDLPGLPIDWNYASLDSCAEKGSITYGVVQPGSALSLGKPLIRVNNFRDGHLDLSEVMHISPEIESKYSRTRLSGGEVLLTIVGSVGQVAVVPPQLAGFNVARAVAVIHPLSHIEPEWVAICLRSPLSQYLLGSRANTTVQTTINLKDLRALPIPLPPHPERTAIIEFLSALDKRITLLRETNATLEAIAQALFKSWFVDFDPVRAKMDGRAPEGMDEATAALFPDGFEESELGAIPRGWTQGKLADIAKTVRRQLPPSSLHDGINYVGLEHMPKQSLSLSTWGRAGGLESAKAVFSNGDILFGKLRPYFHKVVVAPFDGVCSTDVLVCQSTRPEYKALVMMYLFSTELISYADRLSNGAKMPRVNWSDLAEYPVVVPSQQVAEAYTSFVEPLIQRMTHNVHNAQTIAGLRDLLLPRLVSGQLRLPEASDAVAEVIAKEVVVLT